MTQPLSSACEDGLIAAQPCPEAQGRVITPTQRRGVMAACILASSMGFIDGSALTVALPALRADLNAGFAAIQWVVNGYVLALAALTLIGGALADAYGKARMLAVGCVAFALASVACAMAPNVETLIMARVFQGVGAAIMTPASLALLGATYPKRLRNAAIGAWAAASALTTAGGPVLGGWLTETFGWQAIFWLNPPLAAVALLLIVRFAPPDRRSPRRFDTVGAVVLAGALGLFAYGVSLLGGAEGGAAHAPVSVGLALMVLAGAGIGLGAYAVWELHTTHPMTPMHVFADRRFAGLNIATLTIYAALSVVFFILPFELVEVRGLTATQAGMAFLPFTLGVGMLSRVFGRMADRVGARPLLLGGASLSVLAFGGLALGVDAGFWLGVAAPMAMLGGAFAMLVAPLTAMVMSSLSEAEEGLASGMNNAVSRIAQMAGVAAAAAILASLGGVAGYWAAAGLAGVTVAVVFIALPAR